MFGVEAGPNYVSFFSLLFKIANGMSRTKTANALGLRMRCPSLCALPNVAINADMMSRKAKEHVTDSKSSMESMIENQSPLRHLRQKGEKLLCESSFLLACANMLDASSTAWGWR